MDHEKPQAVTPTIFRGVESPVDMRPTIEPDHAILEESAAPDDEKRDRRGDSLW